MEEKFRTYWDWETRESMDGLGRRDSTCQGPEAEEAAVPVRTWYPSVAGAHCGKGCMLWDEAGLTLSAAETPSLNSTLSVSRCLSISLHTTCPKLNSWSPALTVFYPPSSPSQLMTTSSFQCLGSSTLISSLTSYLSSQPIHQQVLLVLPSK